MGPRAGADEPGTAAGALHVVTSPRKQGFGLPAQLPARLLIDDDEYTLPAWDTRTMMRSLSLKEPANWWNLAPGRLADADREHLIRRLIDPADVLDIDELEERVTDALGRVCGMWFWAASRLAATLTGNWMRFDGWCARRGFTPFDQPTSRVLAAGYEWIVSNCEKERQIQQVDSELWAAPPPKLPSGRLRDATPSGWDDRREESTFMSAMSQLGALKSGGR